MLKYIIRSIPRHFISVNNPSYHINLPRYYSFDIICTYDDPKLIEIAHSTSMKYILNQQSYELYQDIQILDGFITTKLQYPLIKLETYQRCKKSKDMLDSLSSWIYCYSDNKLLGELDNYI